MHSKKKEVIINENKLSNAINSNFDNFQTYQYNSSEEINPQNELLIINNDDDQQLTTNSRHYHKEIYINENKKINNNKIPFYKKHIYSKIRSDSYKLPIKKAQISNYIYHT